jgi:hypothetical protein
MKNLRIKSQEKNQNEMALLEKHHIKKMRENYCYIEIKDERMPPTKNEGVFGNGLAYENYDGEA